MKVKAIIVELIILAAIFLITMLVLYWATGFHQFFKPGVDIALHDAYFVFATSTILPPVLCLFIFLVYSVREGLHRYRRRLPNLILLTSVFTINICLFFDFNLARQFASELKFTGADGGWTIYPPLSALPQAQAKHEVLLPDPIEHFFNVFIYTQIFFLLILVIVSVLTARNWNLNKNIY